MSESPSDNIQSEPIDPQVEVSKTIRRKRFFTWAEKEECWKSSSYMIGRDPDRWRLDAYGNPVNKFMKGCFGVFCYEYDHIVPFSKDGESVVENCQILNTYLNRVKSNRTDLGFVEFKKGIPHFDWSEPELDVIEKAVFGNVSRVGLDNYFKRRKGEILEPVPGLLKDPYVKKPANEIN